MITVLFNNAITFSSSHETITRRRRATSAREPLAPEGLRITPVPARPPPPDAPRATRCGWAANAAALDRAYHDTEWGVPLRDERALFELLTLEGAQAGLSWSTVLAKRDGYRRAFDAFDAQRIARYDDADRARLLADAGIVRNRLKIDATIGNARALLALHDAGRTLSDLVWSHVDGRPLRHARASMAEVPAKTELSDRLSKSLAKAGFRFVGSTIVYAFMQAAGLVNDHTVDCFRWAEIDALAAAA